MCSKIAHEICERLYTFERQRIVQGNPEPANRTVALYAYHSFFFAHLLEFRFKIFVGHHKYNIHVASIFFRNGGSEDGQFIECII